MQHKTAAFGERFRLYYLRTVMNFNLFYCCSDLQSAICKWAVITNGCGLSNILTF